MSFQVPRSLLLIIDVLLFFLHSSSSACVTGPETEAVRHGDEVWNTSTQRFIRWARLGVRCLFSSLCSPLGGPESPFIRSHNSLCRPLSPRFSPEGLRSLRNLQTAVFRVPASGSLQQLLPKPWYLWLLSTLQQRAERGCRYLDSFTVLSFVVAHS